jgi:two-component system response regulator FixJ
MGSSMEPIASSHGARHERGSVIIIDDDAALLEALKFGLELEGFSVLCHASAGAVLAATLPASGACLIIDYRLPGLDGLDLLRRLRAKGVELPAIIVTSRPKAALLLRAAALGATIVEKPLLSDALTVAIENAVSRSIGSAL